MTSMGVVAGRAGYHDQVWIVIAPGFYSNEKRMGDFRSCLFHHDTRFVLGAAFNH